MRQYYQRFKSVVKWKINYMIQSDRIGEPTNRLLVCLHRIEVTNTFNKRNTLTSVSIIHAA